MRNTAAAIVLLLSCGLATPKDETTLILTPAQVRLCNSQGGCALITKNRYELLTKQPAPCGQGT